ncbi:MAG: double zinc ribbon domain-containing protein [Planctomycetales bacterium]|nr:double zinc ribbon domain-containing protein [Planctomycetales bacterium]
MRPLPALARTLAAAARGFASSARGFADLAWPPRCLACGRDLREEEGPHLCDPCAEGVPRIQPPTCAWCGSPLGAFLPVRAPCDGCPSERPAYRLARAAARYAGPVRALVLAAKYAREPAACEPLGRLLAEALALPPAPALDALVPVPLHRWTRLRRGYDQAERVAEAAGGALGVPVAHGSLVRVRRTAPQAGLEAGERLRNVAGAFRVRRKSAVAGLRLLLVDDVLTTGATASACAEALLAAGAAWVGVGATARAVLRVRGTARTEESEDMADEPATP